VKLVLLHGFSNTHACWRRVLAAAGGSLQNAWTPDIRGHGASSALRPVTLDAVLEDLATGAPERFVLGGYSQGGRIALHAALDPRLAARVERLVLLSASPGIADADQRAARREADERLAAQLERGTISDFAASWTDTPVLADLPPELAAEATQDRMSNTVDGLAAALRGLGTGALPSLWDRLSELQVPVALIVGARDAKFKAIAAEMSVLLPEAAVHVVEGAGHAVHLEQPAAVERVLCNESLL
jgi:2-succinyl-6-hydroxy-2,4-cyclohexadiene-1-carboxylate synthase